MSDDLLTIAYMSGFHDGKKTVSSHAVLADVRADIEHLIGYLNITLDLMEQEREEKRILRKSEFIQIRQLCNKVSEHFS